MKILIILVLLLLPTNVLAQQDFGVSAVVPQSEEQIKAIETNSKVTPEQQTVPVHESAFLQIELLGIDNQVIASHPLSIKITRSDGSFEEKKGETDVNGVYNFSLNQQTPEVVKVEVRDTYFKNPIKLLKEAQISFIPIESEKSTVDNILSFFGGILGLLSELFN